MHVLVTGATGFVGRRLCAALAGRGDHLTVLSRSPARAGGVLPPGTGAHAWDPLAGPPPAAALDGVDAVVALHGEPVDGRWTEGKRRAIAESRVLGTRNLVAGMAEADAWPRVLVSASGIGYYGDRGDEELVESSPPGPDDDFLVRTCVAWEAEVLAAGAHGVRAVPARFGIILHRDGGALARMLLPFRLLAGGPMGSGRQWWSWVHLDDVVGMVLHALDGDHAGPLNATAPEPVRQRDFARALGRGLRRPAVVPAPAFALRAALGGFAQELLFSKRVLPAAAEASGYRFRYRDLDAGLAAALRG